MNRSRRSVAGEVVVWIAVGFAAFIAFAMLTAWYSLFECGSGPFGGGRPDEGCLRSLLWKRMTPFGIAAVMAIVRIVRLARAGRRSTGRRGAPGGGR